MNRNDELLVVVPDVRADEAAAAVRPRRRREERRRAARACSRRGGSGPAGSSVKLVSSLPPGLRAAPVVQQREEARRWSRRPSVRCSRSRRRWSSCRRSGPRSARRAAPARSASWSSPSARTAAAPAGPTPALQPSRSRVVVADRRDGGRRAVALAREVPEQRELDGVALAAAAAHEQQRRPAERVAVADRGASRTAAAAPSSTNPCSDRCQNSGKTHRVAVPALSPKIRQREQAALQPPGL